MELWPKGAWLGITRRRLLGALRTAVFLLLCVMVMFTGWFLFGRYRAHEARQLLSDVQSLRIGESGFADVQPLVKRYPKNWMTESSACTPNNCEYSMLVNDVPFYSLGAKSEVLARLIRYVADTSILNHLGCQNWFVIAGFSLRNDRVEETSGHVFVETEGYSWLDVGWQFSRQIPEWQLKSVAGRDYSGYEPGKHLTEWHNLLMGWEECEGVDWTVTTAATDSERQDAFAINTKCLTILGGCRTLRELQPKITKYMPDFDR